jgi:hypothetical protein
VFVYFSIVGPTIDGRLFNSERAQLGSDSQQLVDGVHRGDSHPSICPFAVTYRCRIIPLTMLTLRHDTIVSEQQKKTLAPPTWAKTSCSSRRVQHLFDLARLEGEFRRYTV